MQDATLAGLAIYALYVLGLCVAFVAIAALLGERSRHTAATREPYESGILGAGSTHFRLSSKFYLVAVFFVIFDLEAVYIFAWALVAREAGWAGYIELMIFIGVLLAALVYLWRDGALDWGPRTQRKRDARPAQQP